MNEKNENDISIIKQIGFNQLNIEEEILFSARNPFYLLFNHFNFPIIVIDKENLNILDSNDNAVVFFKYTKEELKGLKVFDFFIQDGNEIIKKKFLDYDFNPVENLATINKTGEKCSINVTFNISFFKGKEVIIVCFFKTIADQNLNQKQDKESDLKKILQIANLGSWKYSDQDQSLRLSTSLLKILEIDGKSKNISFDFLKKNVVAEDLIKGINLIKEKINTKKPGFMEIRVKRKDGEIKHLSVNFKIYYVEGKLDSILGSAQEITKLKVAQATIREEEKKIKTFMQSASDLIFLANINGKLEFVNNSMVKETGYSSKELLKMNLFELFQKDEIDKYKTKIDQLYHEQRVTFRHIWITKSGSKFYGDLKISKDSANGEGINKIFGVVRNITENILNEEKTKIIKKQLWHSQKIEALGTLASGIAHDFNNILSTIIGYTELTSSKIKDNPKLTKNLDNVLLASGKAKELISQILTFSRTTEPKFDVIRITPLIEEVLRIIRSSIPKEIQIKFYSNVSKDYIKADKVQFQQVMMNLITNASQSIKIKHNGLINIEFTRTQIVQHISPEHYQMKAGSYFKIKVSDTGCGMSSEVKERIFEPYFTTKELGEGTGLGLAITYGIIKNFKGGITVRSKPGKGTTFLIFIPEYIPEQQS